MKLAKTRMSARARSRRGFTLVETMIALSIFSVVGYGMFVALDIGFDSSEIVVDVSRENRALRSAVRSLNDEMGQAQDASVTIGAGIKGNDVLSFMVPIVVAGTETFGVYDRTLGTAEADWSHENWQYRYTVEIVVVDGQERLDLVRQIIDEDETVIRHTTVAENLHHGNVDEPGFDVVRNGEMWVVTCTTYGSATSKQASSTSFHIRTRN